MSECPLGVSSLERDPSLFLVGLNSDSRLSSMLFPRPSRLVAAWLCIVVSGAAVGYMQGEGGTACGDGRRHASPIAEESAGSCAAYANDSTVI